MTLAISAFPVSAHASRLSLRLVAVPADSDIRHGFVLSLTMVYTRIRLRMALRHPTPPGQECSKGKWPLTGVRRFFYFLVGRTRAAHAADRHPPLQTGDAGAVSVASLSIVTNC